VKLLRLSIVPLTVVVAVAALANDYQSAAQKVAAIEGDQLKPGARVDLTVAELNAYVDHEKPDGVRNLNLQITSPGTAYGTALVDFVKLQRALGYRPNWLVAKILDGERPVSVTAHISSSDGQATVDVRQVSVSGLEIDGGTLDFLIQRVLIPMYPNAVVGRPFDLGHRIEKLDVQPRRVAVTIGR
jgi:hypothetical protein